MNMDIRSAQVHSMSKSLTETFLKLNMPIHYIHQLYNWYVGNFHWLLNGEIPKVYQWYNEKPW